MRQTEACLGVTLWLALLMAASKKRLENFARSSSLEVDSPHSPWRIHGVVG
jgi:hypothetical protein